MVAPYEPRQVNKVLFDALATAGGRVTLLLSLSISCPGTATSWPRPSSPRVQWRVGAGSPPGQEHCRLRELWFSTGSTEHDGEPSGGSAGT